MKIMKIVIFMATDTISRMDNNIMIAATPEEPRPCAMFE
jgi:hypothetical protein